MTSPEKAPCNWYWWNATETPIQKHRPLNIRLDVINPSFDCEKTILDAMKIWRCASQRSATRIFNLQFIRFPEIRSRIDFYIAISRTNSAEFGISAYRHQFTRQSTTKSPTGPVTRTWTRNNIKEQHQDHPWSHSSYLRATFINELTGHNSRNSSGCHLYCLKMLLVLSYWIVAQSRFGWSMQRLMPRLSRSKVLKLFIAILLTTALIVGIRAVLEEKKPQSVNPNTVQQMMDGPSQGDEDPALHD